MTYGPIHVPRVVHDNWAFRETIPVLKVSEISIRLTPTLSDFQKLKYVHLSFTVCPTFRSERPTMRVYDWGLDDRPSPDAQRPRWTRVHPRSSDRGVKGVGGPQDHGLVESSLTWSPNPVSQLSRSCSRGTHFLPLK